MAELPQSAAVAARNPSDIGTENFFVQMVQAFGETVWAGYARCGAGMPGAVREESLGDEAEGVRVPADRGTLQSGIRLYALPLRRA